MTLHIFSHNDLDGVGCGILAKLAFKDQVEVRYNSVQGLDFQVERFLEQKADKHELLITDLSVHNENEAKLESFFKKGGKVQLLDHHKTALHFNKYKWAKVQVTYDDGRLASATSLLYDYYKEQKLLESNPTIDRFVELIRQWDTWEWDKNNTIEAKRLNDLFYMISIEEFEERMLNRLLNASSFTFDDFEEKILDMEDNKIERYIHRKRRELIQTFIDDLCVGVVYAESYHSELGNVIGKDCPHLDYIAILNMGGKKIAFRTIHDEVDVSQIANQFGGGGHSKAAGCSINEDAYKLFITNTFPLDSLKIDAPKNQVNLKGRKEGCLYADREENYYIITPSGEQKYKLIKDQKTIEIFNTFEEAERYLKRNYAAYLVRDDVFDKYKTEAKKEGHSVLT
ncbi:DHH family phosphoesterase [Halalkalibacter akibai]|uniref:3'-to-5' oligoribonuclease B n=1 Tax=Halalkalibacter akibai (strain ATCC 43226 / DSM 21942 / CIP 109018 / JCM 9157 / 1139) TaxID=1236973 RepID=W4R051_HALA3|nr:DHHA1 domain-containing protein [Halalkalibacter akibai]GAE37527.1 3'-to-5' oligoribonuclease B [Halalkalibacter akibai JCM 9157]